MLKACRQRGALTVSKCLQTVDVDSVVDHVSQQGLIRAELQGWPALLAHGLLEELCYNLASGYLQDLRQPRYRLSRKVVAQLNN